MASRTGIGIGIGIPFMKKGGGDMQSLPPEIKESLVGIWLADSNTNDSANRNIIKNNIPNAGGDFELLNFAYKLNSGYGKYEEDFSTWRNSGHIEVEYSRSKLKIISENVKDWWVIAPNNGISNSFRVKITNCHYPIVWRYTDDGNSYKDFFIGKDGIYDLPQSISNNEGVVNRCYFGSYTQDNDYTGLTIEQIPSFQGALVTDGVNDIIQSQKTAQEMLGGSNEITVVSMIHQISTANAANIRTNFLCDINQKHEFLDNIVANINKTGIYGYTYDAVNANVVNNILGDKNDYTTQKGTDINIKSLYSVQGYVANNGNILNVSQVAWYWTFIANRVLTTDEINQVIAYYNLDKYVKPDIYYDVKKQGLSNDTPDADWYLKDFSGNGRDMQLYNYGKTPESGINEEGGLQSDGVTDYGQFVGDLGLKDYTIAVDRAYPSLKGNGVPVISGINRDTVTPFLFEFADNTRVVRPYSFGATTVLSPMELSRKISYQSTYIYDGTTINKGVHNNTGNGLTIGRFGIDTQYANIALWSLLLFPYTLSEFLLERQLKRYKLGTLYPDMIEFRPIITGNIPYDAIEISQGSTVLYNYNINKTGIYLQEGSTVRVYIKASGIDEVSKITINEVSYTDLPININGNYYADFPITKSPQKISYVIDEYVRYEDIVQPYPAIVNLRQDDKTITWGDKLKVGSEVTFVNHTNLLPDLYTIGGGVQYNGTSITWNTPIVVEKSMTFTSVHTYKKANEPNCILAPQILRIPNSSYKILRYIPDLTGKGNHGVFDNFAFTEESGVDSNGIVHFDGVEDYITIPTLSHGAKQILMKVNWQEINRISYDQRGSGNAYVFAIYTSDEGDVIAYNTRNNGKTYIDGVLNSTVMASQLKNITHNIAITNDNVTDANSISPRIGCSNATAFYSKMALFAFMSFDNISSDEEIKELNDIIGIEGSSVES